MRRTIIGLAAVASLAVLGCSDSEDGVGNSNAGSSSTEEFCDEYLALEERFTGEDADASQEEVLEAIRGLNPPDEIADDFRTAIDGVEEVEDLDPADPDDEERITELNEAQANVQQFLTDECGVGPETTG
ncbi:MAG: hypothetical protein JXA83_13290 [Acidimicrobiales bacterium]|nr:hypothetical protein [Acidimicrobiales bacterium]